MDDRAALPSGDAHRRRRVHGSPSGDRCSSPEDFEVDVSDGEQADIHDMEDEGDQVDYDD